MKPLFHEQHEIQRGSNAVADTTSETTSAVADLEDVDDVTFAVELGDVDSAAVLTFTVKENTANSTSSPTPTQVTLDSKSGDEGVITSGALVLTEDTAGNLDNKTVLITVGRANLSKRYVFLSITATTESYEVNAITIIKSRQKRRPVTQPSNVISIAVGVK